MFRLLSILLLAAFGLPFLQPLLAMGQGADAGLPACCRRDGKHHCMMSVGERSKLASHDPQFQAPFQKCPFSPSSVTPAPSTRLLPPGQADAIFGDLVSHPAGVAQTECKRRIARDRSRQMRGPPAQTLL